MKMQRLLTIFIVFMMSLTTISGISVSSDTIDAEQELDLLHGETSFDVMALEDVTSSFNLSYIAPLKYGNQAPILVQICSDSTANILSYSILNDTNEPNKIINFTIGPMKKGENGTIHFQYWVLVKNNEYADLPKYVKIPKKDELPEDVKTFLVSTQAIQSNSILIRLKARQLKGLSNNLIRLANRVVLSTSNFLHIKYYSKLYNQFRDLLHNLACKISSKEGDYYWYPLQDAQSVLLFLGSCTGVANLGAALFRANGVPAKTLIITPTFLKEIPYEQHWMCEYYCPDYGWIPAEPMYFSTPPKNFVDKFGSKMANKLYGVPNQTFFYEPKNYIILRINHPEDENLAGGGLSYYGGIEPYYWWEQDDKIECDPPNTHGWIEKELTTNQDNANLAFNLTKDVYELYNKYLGMELTGGNLLHFDNAMIAQQSAIDCFIQSDIDGYFNDITIAYNEYQQIT